MHIEHLSLTNFRNYARLEVSLPRRPTVLYGGNAQGKTSLLEAIYYLATSRSPYTTSDRQLIHWRTQDDPLPFARLTAELSGQGRPLSHLEMTLMMDTSSGTARFKKVVRLNGVDKRVMDVVGLVSVVLFLPQDLSLVEGSPSDRRRFMDDTLMQMEREYIEALNTYEKALPQRNALLRRIADGQAGRDELPYWDEQLATAGSLMIAARQRFLRELETGARRAHHDLTGGREMLTLQYLPGFLPTAAGDGQLSFDVAGLDLHRELTPEQVTPQFLARLQNELPEALQRGMTLSGPHRDELRLFINGRDCGLYGSRGQARTAVIALKMAQLDWMRGRIGEWPLLLMDEVVAELDSARRRYLLDRLSEGPQTLLTTAELEVFPQDFLARAAVWHVVDGQIEMEESRG